MEKQVVFFKEQGLTSTSANHIANLAKEAYKELENELASTIFYTTTVSLISSEESKQLRKGVDSDFLDSVAEKLKKIARLKSLIAWLREAIKAKETLKSETEDMHIKDIAERLGIKVPEEPEYKEDAAPVMTEEEYWASKNVKERNHYLELETECAVIGQAIHPDGWLARSRKRLFEVINKPNEISGGGRDTLLHSYTPTVSVGQVEDTYFALQKKHRALQAELNKLKHECEMAIAADKRRNLTEQSNIIAENRRLHEEYVFQNREFYNKTDQFREKELERIAALKIVIPDSLKDVYNEISNLG